MCGIAGIISKQQVLVNSAELIRRMSTILKHRGPDGEGFLLAGEKESTPCFGSLNQVFTRKDLPYLPQTRLQDCGHNHVVAFAHRRLSIIDLSETGHQPMCSTDQQLWITYNGEIYNYIELRLELKTLGYSFVSESDTEVILRAYEHWGAACVNHFNGMWSFCIYDMKNGICFASRDRLGVKPFYYVNNREVLAFASEQKALTGSGLIKPAINPKALHNYLINGILENEPSNFFEGVTELWPGTSLIYNIKTNALSIEPYFHLSQQLHLKNDALDEQELIERINHALENAVRIRLRSDVEVGTCLSGGIDSSALAVIISSITKTPLYCFTSVFRNRDINEELYSDIVSQHINGKHLKTEPDPLQFYNEVGDLVYSQDVPIWSTSTYAQYKVMELAGKNGIKVVLDGQGADELFAGYHHHFVAQWNNLLNAGRLARAYREIKAAGKSIDKPFLFYLKERLKNHYYPEKNHFQLLFHKDFLNAYEIKNPSRYFSDVNERLLDDIYNTRLKSFLKCEDRCGMWHSVESRTPFSDDTGLMNLLFSFNGNRKIKDGVSKYLLREALKSKLPAEIYSRYDKKGFETPMQEWMIQLRQDMMKEIKEARFDFVNYTNLERTQATHVFQNKLMFKLFILARWHKVFI